MIKYHNFLSDYNQTKYGVGNPPNGTNSDSFLQKRPTTYIPSIPTWSKPTISLIKYLWWALNFCCSLSISSSIVMLSSLSSQAIFFFCLRPFLAVSSSSVVYHQTHKHQLYNLARDISIYRIYSGLRHSFHSPKYIVYICVLYAGYSMREGITGQAARVKRVCQNRPWAIIGIVDW